MVARAVFESEELFKDAHRSGVSNYYYVNVLYRLWAVRHAVCTNIRCYI
jgi:hypothetical protein